MANLALFRFTDLADNAKSGNSWYIFDKSVVVKTLAGNDTITGKGSDTGISNYKGTINTGAGNDRITGTGSDTGISDYYGTINTGEGNDIITGTGGYTGIESYNGTIDTGAGNDTITGIGKDCGIDADMINTGTGDDIIDALKGGFEINQAIYLGSGNDTLKGFGDSVNVWGGAGTDKILFGEGTYIVSEYRIDSDTETMYRSMYFNEFEQIGGANGGLFAIVNGTLTVDSAGIGTFA